MLRNRCGWAWRLFVAFLLPFFYSSLAQGGPLIGVPPPKPPIPSAPPTTPVTTSSISGYVYFDSAQDGVQLPTDAGLPAVQVNLAEYSPNNPYQPIDFYTAYTNSAGYYTFNNLPTGTNYYYTLVETQPSGFTATASNVGNYVNATSGTLTAPMVPFTDPISGNTYQFPSNGTSYNANLMYFITLPTASTLSPSPSNGAYSAVDYNFGDFRQITTPPPVGTIPSLSTALAIVGNNNRFLAGPGAGSLTVAGSVENSANAGASSLDWQISSLSSGLSLTPTAGSDLAPQNTTLLTGAIDGTNLSSGTQNASVSVYGRVSGTGKSLGTSTASVVIDPVYSRGIDSVSTTNFGRVMQGSSNSSTVTVTSAGSYYNYSNLTMNGGATAGETDTNGSFSVTNGSTVTFDGTTTTNSGVTFNATFSSSASGPISTTAAIPGNTGLFTGETLASGTPVLPTLAVPYTATVLAPRQLAPATGGPTTPFTVPSATGGLLYGAVVPIPTAYSVTSLNANPDSNHATMVYVGGSSPPGQTVTAVSTADGVTQVGQVTVAQTLVASGGNISVPVSVGAYALGPISGSASLSVATAEAASVNDTTNYAPVGLAYNISNVGYAATGGVSGTDANTQLFGAPLSAPFAAGSVLAPSPLGTSLTSIVASAGTAGANSTATGLTNTTLSSSATVDSGNFAGTVGSQADILASTPLSTSATVTMAWRNRNNAENGTFIDPSFSTQLPPGVQWLTSDVVNIQGIPSDTIYAMQMSFDNRINTFIGGPSDTATVAGSYLGKYVNGQWENAVIDDNTAPGIDAQTGVAESLSTFLAAQYANGYTLADLVGSWGVDLTNQESWAIINNGTGQFAVVPEPATLVLLAGSVVALMVFRTRRKVKVVHREVS